MTSDKCCTGDCNQGRNCPARFADLRNGGNMPSGSTTITITLISAVFTLSVLIGFIWGVL